ncbi:MAG: DUF4935 domain-containing protein [candidate division Zixibacteria bacterium]|nr:DUF4935 domain-containing protein [candidate division Zixibacteria bacterium]
MISWPKGIYLEASVLCTLPRDIINAEMERLKQVCTLVKAPILIPEVSLQEWIANRRETINKYITNVESGLAEMAKIFDYVERINWPKDRQSIVDDTEYVTKKILDENGISVIETPDIDLKKLVSMSVNKIRPFEEGNEKGFRDSVNLFTVLKHAEKEKEGYHLFVARDNIYKDKDIQDFAQQYNVELIVVSSISDAISKLEEFIKHVMKTIDTYEKTVLNYFLLRNADKISEYIRQNGEFPLFFLNKGYRLGLVPRIERIDSISVIKIDSVTRGILPKGADEGKVKISFTARTRFDVRVREVVSSPVPRLKYGKAPFPSSFDLLAFLADGAERTLNKVTEIDIPIEGSVYLTREKDQEGIYQDKYSDLQIDNLIIR